MSTRHQPSQATPEETGRAESAAPAPVGLLDRPLFDGLRLNWWHVALIGLALFLLFTRFYDLGSRGFCHDESIHAWESWKLETGQGYRHNPVYHGPLLYHLTALVFAVFGDSDVTARLLTSLVGVLIALTPLLFRRWLGKWGTLAAIAFMAISPVLMFRSRFIRHDHLAILFNIIMGLAILRYLAERKTRDLYWLAAALSLSLAGKETSFITIFILGTFLFLYWASHWLRDRSLTWREMVALPSFDLMIVIGTLILPFAAAFPIAILGGDPVDYNTGLVWKGLVLLAMFAISALVGVLWDRRRWLVCAGIFWGIFLPLFTSLFTNPVEGFATGTVGQLGYWLSQHGVARGDQPWYYYLFTMSLYEYLPVLVGAGGVVYYLRRGEPEALPQAVERPGAPPVPFVALFIYWSVVAFVAYSWAGEKMPWLNMHLVAPLDILAGWTIGRLLRTDWRAIRERGGAWLLCLGPAFLYLLVRVLTNRPLAGTTVAAQQAWVGFVVLLAGLGCVAALVVRLLSRLAWAEGLRMVTLSVLIVLAGFTLRDAWRASFTNANYATEFLVYAHGTPDTVMVSHELEDLSRRLTGGLHLKVAYDDKSSWPFEWYLRNYDRRQFIGNLAGAPFDAEVVILGLENEAANRAFLGNRYYRRQYRLIWWPDQDFYFHMTPKKVWDRLRDPVQRQEIVDVVLRRQYPRSVDDWYLVAEFAMYVRRDVAAQLWDMGPEVLALGEPLPGDEYVERWQQRPASNVLGSGLLQSPKDVAVDAAGNLYVACGGSSTIQVLDPQGALLRVIGHAGSDPGGLSEPWGVALGPDGEVYVADTWNHRVQVFDAQGRYLRSWGIFGSTVDSAAGALLYGPRDIVVDAQGDVYVSDTGNKRVIKYDAQGEVLAVIGGAGSEAGQFQEPVGLALDADGNLYVADTWNQRIQVFDRQLRFVRQWTVYAWESASIVNKPYLAVDARGHVVASDPEGYRVLEFDAEGTLVASWGQFGTDLLSMNLPTGVTFGPDGWLYVADAENGRVLVYAVGADG